MEVVCNTLRKFCSEAEPLEQIDEDLFNLLGEATAAKKWLAASLDKTIRLQLDPTPEMRSMMSFLAAPEWIRQK
jgi:hypothetical protein